MKVVIPESHIKTHEKKQYTVKKKTKKTVNKDEKILKEMFSCFASAQDEYVFVDLLSYIVESDKEGFLELLNEFGIKYSHFETKELKTLHKFSRRVAAETFESFSGSKNYLDEIGVNNKDFNNDKLAYMMSLKKIVALLNFENLTEIINEKTSSEKYKYIFNNADKMPREEIIEFTRSIDNATPKIAKSIYSSTVERKVPVIGQKYIADKVGTIKNVNSVFLISDFWNNAVEPEHSKLDTTKYNQVVGTLKVEEPNLNTYEELTTKIEAIRESKIEKNGVTGTQIKELSKSNDIAESIKKMKQIEIE